MLLQEVAGAVHPLAGTVARWMWALPLLPLLGFVLNGALSLAAQDRPLPALDELLAHVRANLRTDRTLLSQYTPDEIEVVVAHELGHQVHNDIPKLILVQSVTMLGGLYLVNLALHELDVLIEAIRARRFQSSALQLLDRIRFCFAQPETSRLAAFHAVIGDHLDVIPPGFAVKQELRGLLRRGRRCDD